MGTPEQQGTAEQTIRVLNDRFIAACAAGSWEMLRTVLSESFGHVDGETGQHWDHERYVASMAGDRTPNLTIDQGVIRVLGDVACVPAGTPNGTGRHNRHVYVYAREPGGWAGPAYKPGCGPPSPPHDSRVTTARHHLVPRRLRLLRSRRGPGRRPVQAGARPAQGRTALFDTEQRMIIGTTTLREIREIPSLGLDPNARDE